VPPTPQLRFIARIEHDWTGAISCPQDAAWEPRKIDLRKLACERGCFPGLALPLHDPGVAHGSLAGEADPAAIVALYDAALQRDAASDNVARYGHYLFDALLGQDNWADMQMRAEERNASFLELALRLPADDDDLQRLNWELLRSDTRFLVAQGPKLDVTITRIIGHDGPVPAALEVPPRVLFVVGTALTEEKIRPAAELYSLLRQARQGYAMRYRLLERASPQRLRATIREFHPQIVHFICHGGVDPQGVHLMLATDDEDGLSPERYAPQLLGDLRDGDWMPTVVVLSACLTAGDAGAPRYVLAGVHKSAPLAARLVQGGIPIVLGMAGRVADITSRLFARRLTEAVVEGVPLVKATALARQAAFVDGGNPDRTIDWALPAVFMADTVPPGYRPVANDEQRRLWDDIEGWIREAKLVDDPVFCGRDALLVRFHRMLTPPQPGPGPKAKKALVLVVDDPEPGYGRTRLLMEFGAQAFREGHLPLLLSNAPKDYRRFLYELDAAIIRLRNEVLGLDVPVGQLRLLARRDADHADLDPLIRLELEDHTEFTTLAMAQAIRADLEALVTEAAEAYPFFAAAQVVVLLDDIHEYGDELLRGLLDDGLLGASGFGTKQRPIPVVMTGKRASNLETQFKRLEESPSSRSWLEVRQLERLRDDGEDMLACQAVLLNPFERDTMGSPNVAYAYNGDVEESVRKVWERRFREELAGLPIRFRNPTLLMYAELAATARYLVLADDQKRMDQLEKRT
jgi:hypothetical protein